MDFTKKEINTIRKYVVRYWDGSPAVFKSQVTALGLRIGKNNTHLGNKVSSLNVDEFNMLLDLQGIF